MLVWERSFYFSLVKGKVKFKIKIKQNFCFCNP